MATTFSDGLKIKLIGTGLEAGTWGTSTNENLNRLDQATSSKSTVDITSLVSPSSYGSNIAVLALDDNAAAWSTEGAARSRFLEFTGSVSSDQTVKIAGNSDSDLTGQTRTFWAKNSLTGTSGRKITFNNGGTTVDLLLGSTALIHLESTSGNFEVVNPYETSSGVILGSSTNAYEIRDPASSSSYLKFNTSGSELSTGLDFVIDRAATTPNLEFKISGVDRGKIYADTGNKLFLMGGVTADNNQITIDDAGAEPIQWKNTASSVVTSLSLTPGFDNGLKAEYLGSITKVGSAVTPTANYQTYTFDLSDAKAAGVPGSNGALFTRTITGTFSSVPSLTVTYLKCVSAELGYLVGDILEFSPFSNSLTNLGAIVFRLSGGALTLEYSFTGGAILYNIQIVDRSNAADYPYDEIDYDKWELVTNMWF
jgi:hypothetical protein